MSNRFNSVLVAVVLVVMIATRPPGSPVQAQEDQRPAITAGNGGRLTLLHTLGLGALLEVHWLKDGRTILAPTTTGIWRYDTATPDALPTRIGEPDTTINRIFLSDDEQWLANTPVEGGRLRLLNLTTGDTWEAFQEPKHLWSTVLFSPLGYVIGFSDAQRVWIYDLSRRRVIRTIEDAFQVALAADGKTLAVATARRISLWDVTTQQESARILTRGLAGELRSLRFAADGKTLYVLQTANALTAYDMPTRRPTYTLPTPTALNVLYDAAGRTALVWGSPRENADAQLLDLATGQATVTLRAADSVPNYGSLIPYAALSADGARAATVSHDGKLRVWDTTSGQRLAERRVLSRFLSSLAFDPTGTRLIFKQRDSVVVYDIAADTLRPLLGHVGQVGLAVQFTLNGEALLTAGYDGSVNLWTADTWQPRSLMIPHSAFETYHAAISPDGKQVVFGDSAGGWRYDLSPGAGKPLSSLWHSPCYIVAFSPDGQWLACATDSSVLLWDEMTRKLAWDFEQSQGSGASISSLTFSADSQALLIAPYDGTVRTLDLTGEVTLRKRTNTLIGHDTSLASLVPSPDGRTLASFGADHVLRLWDIRTGQERRALRSKQASPEYLPRNTVVAFNPAGTLVAAIYAFRQWRVYDVTTGQLVAESDVAPTGDLAELTFSPDGTLLAVTTRSGQVMLWGVRP